MSKIYPTASKLESGNYPATSEDRTTVWTVWKKSSMAFHGSDGFSVYDSEGRLALRVDNYSRRHKYLSGEILLMDGAGSPLLALRPQIMSLHDRWNVFEASSKAGPGSRLFTMRRRSVLQHGDEADVFTGKSESVPDYRIEGCFRRRCCKIQGREGEVVAQISPKKSVGNVALGNDVFNVVVEPGVNFRLMMAFVVVMDRICHKPHTPMMCS